MGYHRNLRDQNDNGVGISIPYGPKNASARDTSGLRPTRFDPGLHPFAFGVDFTAGQTASWTLSPDNNPSVTRSATSATPGYTAAQAVDSGCVPQCRAQLRSGCTRAEESDNCVQFCADIGHVVEDFIPDCNDERVAWQSCVNATPPGADNWDCSFVDDTSFGEGDNSATLHRGDGVVIRPDRQFDMTPRSVIHFLSADQPPLAESAPAPERGSSVVQTAPTVRKRGSTACFRLYCAIRTRMIRQYFAEFHQRADQPPPQFRPCFETGGSTAGADAKGTMRADQPPPESYGRPSPQLTDRPGEQRGRRVAQHFRGEISRMRRLAGARNG